MNVESSSKIQFYSLVYSLTGKTNSRVVGLGRNWPLQIKASRIPRQFDAERRSKKAQL